MRKIRPRSIYFPINRIFLVLFTIALLSSSFGSTAGDPQDPYDCNFQFNSGRWSSNESSFCALLVDSTLMIGRKHPYFFGQRGYITPYPLLANLSQTFILPATISEKAIKISINNKCQNINKAILRLTCSNKEEQIVYKDSININSEDWKMKTAQFRVRNAILMNIQLEFLGDSVDLDTHQQKVWLDRINISIDGVDISKFPINGELFEKTMELDKSFVVPLLGKDNEFTNLIQKKKIVGLGETVHGSPALNNCAYEIIENQVEQGNCNLILMEIPVMEGMIFNLFVQNKISISEYTEKLDLPNPTTVEEEFSLFIKWLTEYNKSTQEKVNLFGFDAEISQMGVGMRRFADYIMLRMNDDNAKYLAPLLNLFENEREDYTKIPKYLDTNVSSLKNIIGESDLELLRHATYQQIKSMDDIWPHRRALRRYEDFIHRDSKMFLNTQKCIDLYSKTDKITMLAAHFGHLNKLGVSSENPTIKNLGSYMSEYYKNEYLTLALTVGEGARVRANLGNGNQYRESLQTAPPFSIEKLGLDTQLDLFYYPSSAIPEEIKLIRFLGNGSQRFDSQFVYSALKERVDGFIFVRDSKLPDSYPKKEIIIEQASLLRDKRDLKIQTTLKKYASFL